MIADTACAELVLNPHSFDVILTSNTFGDLLSSLGSAVAGSQGLVGGLSSGYGIHVAEAGHGDASTLAGQDRVNPVAIFDSIRLLFGDIGLMDAAKAIRSALGELKTRGPSTLDLGGIARTSEVTEFACARARELLEQGH